MKSVNHTRHNIADKALSNRQYEELELSVKMQKATEESREEALRSLEEMQQNKMMSDQLQKAFIARAEEAEKVVEELRIERDRLLCESELTRKLASEVSSIDKNAMYARS